MRTSLRLGRIFGFELRADTSWILVLALVVWSLSSLFAGWHPEWTPPVVFAVAVFAALSFFASVVVHELAHSVVARLYGVPVRDITLHMFGGVSNIEREPPTPGAELLIAIVGPLTSLGLGIAMLILGAFATGLLGLDADAAAETIPHMGPLATTLLWLGPINVIVGVFNLVPGFPLDGGRILRAILWKVTGDIGLATRWATGAGQVVGYGFVLGGVLMAMGIPLPFFGRGLMPGLWLALIGLFLKNAAVRHRMGSLIQEALVGVRVCDLMRSNGAWVAADVPLRTLVTDWFLRREEQALPVFDEGQLVGLVCFDDARRVPSGAWSTRTVRDVMTPLPRLMVAGPDEELLAAMKRLASAGVRQLPVVRQGKLVGMLHERDVARWIELAGDDVRGGVKAAPRARVRTV